MSQSQVRGAIPDWTIQVVVLLFGFTAIAQPFVIPSGSMEGNLLVGDHVIVDKMAYSPAGSLSRHLLPYSEVKRGDIVVFRYPPDIDHTYVKRIVGIPGDRIRIVARQLYLNGRPVAEPYKRHIDSAVEPYRDRFPGPPAGPVDARAVKMLRDHVVDGELVVPEGRYFALGDNRDNSLDSRYWGFVPRENIVGKPVLIWWSFDAPGEHLQDAVRLDHIADVALHFFTRTRWGRTFRLVRPYPLS
jgi:signal peptidase I